MVPARKMFAALLLVGMLALSGCFSDSAPADDPPVVIQEEPAPMIPHNVTAYPGTITLSVRGPTPSGSIFSSASGGVQSPVKTTTDYTGMVVKLSWSATSDALATLKLVGTPESDTVEPIVVAGISPVFIVVDMTVAAPRTWRIDVQADDNSNPVGAAASQSFVVTVGQYAGQNNTFDPAWDPVAP